MTIFARFRSVFPLARLFRGLGSLLLLLSAVHLPAQTVDETDAFFIKRLHDAALGQPAAYDWLQYLTRRIGGRLSGSPQAAAAVEYTAQVLDTLGLDRVERQPVRVPHWVRGAPEVVRITSSVLGSAELPALALGGSPGTGPLGLSAEVIEVQNLDEVDALGERVRGKIVFYNGPMDPTKRSTFAAYGAAGAQRVRGPERAAQYGAVAAVVRSLTTRLDDIPHTGVTIFPEGSRQIPGLAISTNAAELLSRALQSGPVTLYLRNTSQTLPDKRSHNVIGELRGSTHPDEIILVGGHLDSWDVGTGAHDDATGCVQSMEVLRLLKLLDYRPKRTIRCVLFMNEENGLRGGTEYARVSNEKGEYHLAAIESDRGGFTPRGFTAEGAGDDFVQRLRRVTRHGNLLEPYGLYFQPGGSGADIGPLKSQGGLLFGLLPDDNRYFDYHHTATDLPDVVNERELQLGAAAMASLVYLLDKYGLE